VVCKLLSSNRGTISRQVPRGVERVNGKRANTRRSTRPEQGVINERYDNGLNYLDYNMVLHRGFGRQLVLP